MPKLPTYENPQIATQGLQGGIRPLSESQGAKVLGLAGQVAQIGVSQYEKMKAEQDQNAVSDAVTKQLADDTETMNYGKQFAGAEASGLVDMGMKKRAERVQELAASLPSARAREAFLRNAAHTEVGFQSVLLNHEQEQTQVATMQALSSTSMGLVKSAMESGGDKTQMDIVMSGRDAVVGQLVSMGKNADLEKKRLTSAIVSGAIDKMKDKNLDGATKLYWQNVDDLTPEAQSKLKEDLDSAGSVSLAMSKVADLEASGLDHKDQRRLLQDDKELQGNKMAFTLAESTLKANHLMDKRDKAETQEENFHAARAAVIKAGGPNANRYGAMLKSQALLDMIKNPETSAEGMKLREHYTAQLKANEHEGATRFTPAQQWAAETKFAALTYDPKLSEYSENKLASETAGMPPHMRSAMHTMWAELKGSGGKRLNANKLYIEKALFDNGVTKTLEPKKGSADALAVGQFTAFIEAAAPGQKRVLKWSDKAEQDFVSRWAEQYKIKNGTNILGITFGEKKVPLFEVMRMVPDEFFRSTVQKGKEQGIEVTDETVAMLYAESVTRGGAAPAAATPPPAQRNPTSAPVEIVGEDLSLMERVKIKAMGSKAEREALRMRDAEEKNTAAQARAKAEEAAAAVREVERKKRWEKTKAAFGGGK